MSIENTGKNIFAGTGTAFYGIYLLVCKQILLLITRLTVCKYYIRERPFHYLGGAGRVVFSRLFFHLMFKAGFFFHTPVEARFFFHKELKVRLFFIVMFQVKDIHIIFRVEARLFFWQHIKAKKFFQRTGWAKLFFLAKSSARLFFQKLFQPPPR